MRRSKSNLVRCNLGNYMRSLRPRLEALEVRAQPGSVLLNAVDMLVLADVPSCAEVPLVDASLSSERRLYDDDAHHFSSAQSPAYLETMAQDTVIASRSLSSTDASSEPIATSSLQGMSAQPNQRVVSPVFFAPMVTREARGSAITQPGAQSTMASRAHAVLQKAPVQQKAVQATFNPLTLQSKPFDPARIQRHECDGGGTKAAIYNTYEGSDSIYDVNYSVAAGKGAGNIGKAYSTGFHAGGTIQRYGVGGGCEVGVTLTDPGNAVGVLDIAINTQGVYVVASVNEEEDSSGDHIEGWLLRFDADLNFIAGTTYVAPVGGEIFFSSVALSPNAAIPDVFVSGAILDPSVTSYENTFVASHDTSLATTRYAVYADFSDASIGWSIEADRARNAFIGGAVVNFGAIENVTWRLDSLATGIAWANTLIYDAVTPYDVKAGMFGTKFLGGSSAGGGLYTTGILPSNTLNPGSTSEGLYANLIVAKWNPTDGSLFYGWIWSATGFDYAGGDIVADRDGYAYVGGYIGDDTDRDATLDKFNPVADTIVNYDFVGGIGTQDIGRAVDLVTTSPGADLLIVGKTETASGMMYPTPSGCKATSPGLDGFVMKDMQPLPF